MIHLTRRHFLHACGLGAAAALWPQLALAAAENKRPNIVFIMADDMGYGDPGCNNPQSKTPTPHIDRIAAAGVRFTDAHAPAAWCVPSRYGLLTGRYPLRGSGYSAENMNKSVLEEGRLTLGSLLQKAGYRTACVGKWHLGFEGGHTRQDYTQRLRGGPTDRGFDYYFGIAGSLDFGPYAYIENDRYTAAPTEEIGAGGPGIQGPFWRAGKIAPGFRHDQVLPAMADKSVRFIQDHHKANPGQPFFLYMPLAAPHTPWVPTEPFQGVSKAGSYGDFVAQVDDAVGQVTATLRQLGLEQETLIIFTSDNGPVWYERDEERYEHRSSGPWRGRKADMWEGGHRVPFIARWPGRIPANTTSEQLICFTDMLATFAAITHQPLPRDAGEDSFNILPALLNPSLKPPIRETLVILGDSIRRGEWKLIVGRPDGGITRAGQPKDAPPPPATGCLYNLKTDPAETTNLYDQHPQIVAELKQLLQNYKSAGRSTP